MQFIALKTDGFKVFAAMLAISASMGTMQATLLSTASPAAALTCNTSTGLGTAGTVIIKPTPVLTGSATLVVTIGTTTGGLIITPPSVTTLTASTSAAGLTYTYNLAPGCAGATSATTAAHFQFLAGGATDLTVNATTSVVTNATALSVSPSPIVINCALAAGSYTPGSAQTVSITSAATGGTSFTVDNSTSPPAAWLVVSSYTGGTAGTSSVPFTVAAATGCGTFANGTSNTTTVHLLNAPAPDKTFTVTLQIVGASPLTVAPVSGVISYTKLSGVPGYADIMVTSATTPAPFFAIDSSTLPIWLTSDSTGGTTPKNVRFSSTSIADTLAPGIYKANVRIKVSGSGDKTVPFTLSISNPAATLSVGEGITRNIPWIVGQAIPTPFVTLVSTDAPIPYTLTTGGSLAPIISASFQKGLAYSFGTQIPITFNPLIFAAAQPGSTLIGTVTISAGTPLVTTVVTITVPVQSPGATISSLSPGSLPTAVAGLTFTMSMAGTGFVPSTDPTQKTRVGIVVNGTIISDTNIASTVVNASNMILTITVPVTADAYLPFSPTGAGGSVTLGVCNPLGNTCSTPAAGGSVTFSIGTNPIIQGVTSASSFQEVTAPTLQTTAPFDLLSIFGTNFCSSGGTGCSSTQLLYSTPDVATLRYPTFVSPDLAGLTQRQLSVTFLTHGTTTVIGTAPVLFATNGQINLVAPSTIVAGTTVDIVVNFGYGTGATMKSSIPYPISVLATNPGIFTVGSDGQGDGAILAANYSVINTANPAGMRTTAADSDVVQIYMTGMGTPTSAAANTAGGGNVYITDCVSTANYLAALNAVGSTSLTALDGAVIQSSLINSTRLVPCLATAPTATVGGLPATVTYAGWVPDSVAGLYQVNVKLPGRAAGSFTTAAGTSVTNIVAPVQLPIVVTASTHASQSNVTIWVNPQLKVTGPTAGGLTGKVGAAWAGSNNVVIATEGTPSYSYALSAGLLPVGLVLNPATGAITGVPAVNTSGAYIVTATATDSAAYPLTPVNGSVTFTLNVAGGLLLSAPGAPFNGAATTANPTVTTVTSAGGVYPYTYAITSGAVAGLAIDPATGIVSVSAAVAAGTYNVTITGTDSTTGTPLTGTITFSIILT